MKELESKLESLLFNVSDSLLIRYERDLNLIYKNIISELNSFEQLSTLINQHSIELVKPIIYNHIYFIKEALLKKNNDYILDHIFWELNSYNNMNISFNFYKHLFTIIPKVIKKIDKDEYFVIIKLYEYLLEDYDYLVLQAKSFKNKEKTTKDVEVYSNFIEALLIPDMTKAVNISNDFIKNKSDIKIFWSDVILPSLYNIGAKWANGEITVGQEHTATSICQRVMTLHYEKILDQIGNKKKVLVTTSPMELHEIGARMVSDFLEINGYDVYYFNHQTTFEEIINTIKEEDILDIIISTTLLSNLSATRKFISDIRESLVDKSLKIYVGGQAYDENSLITNPVDADYYISNIDGLLNMIEEE